MNRRGYLATCAGLVAAAGCTSAPRSGPQGTSATSPASEPTPTPELAPSIAARGQPSGICGHVPAEVGIRAITVPATASDWRGIEARGYGTLTAETVVVGLAIGDRPRAYPIRVLWAHEIVNDTIPTATGGWPVLITYCPICRSGLVADRRVAGEPTTFGVSGLLWRPPNLGDDRAAVFGADLVGRTDARRENNLVMYDVATGSYWSQWLARAICGPRTGDTLELVPSTVTTWGAWTDRYPGTDVLLPPPKSGAFNPPYPGSSPPGTPND